MASTHEPLGRELRNQATVVVLGTMMSILDTTIVVVALDSLRKDFHVSLSTIQWVTTGYLLALAIVIPLTGWVVDRFGARNAFLFAIGCFTIGSALCGFAWSAAALIGFRILQGLGGGMIMPIGQTILARAAGPERMGRVMGVVGVPTVLGPILGPVLGGLIVTVTTWRLVFWVNVPIGIVALILAYKVLPRGEHNAAHKLDVVGFALLSPGLAALVYGLSEVGVNGQTFATTKVWVLLAAGLALIVIFCGWALRASVPLLDLRLFRHRTFSIASICIFLMGGALYGALFLLPFYYQVLRGQSALVAGLMMAPQGLGAITVMRWAGNRSDKVGARAVVPIGSAIIVLGTLAYTQVTPTIPLWILAISLYVRGIGMGLAMMPLTAASYRGLSHGDVPRATTTTSILRQIGGSVATAAFAVLLQREFEKVIPLQRQIKEAELAHDATRAHELSVQAANQLSHGFGMTFWWVVALSTAAILPTLFLPGNTKRGGPNDHSPEESSVELALEELAE